jgi:hypothetical protein
MYPNIRLIFCLQYLQILWLSLYISTVINVFVMTCPHGTTGTILGVVVGTGSNDVPKLFQDANKLNSTNESKFTLDDTIVAGESLLT